MPDPINDQWVRVTDPSVKPYREFNVPADAVSDGLKVLKGKPTHNLDGSPIPTKHTPDDLAHGAKADDKSEGDAKK
jgi:hypothetical protein